MTKRAKKKEVAIKAGTALLSVLPTHVKKAVEAAKRKLDKEPKEAALKELREAVFASPRSRVIGKFPSVPSSPLEPDDLGAFFTTGLDPGKLTVAHSECASGQDLQACLERGGSGLLPTRRVILTGRRLRFEGLAVARQNAGKRRGARVRRLLGPALSQELKARPERPPNDLVGARAWWRLQAAVFQAKRQVYVIRRGHANLRKMGKFSLFPPTTFPLLTLLPLF